ncbi:MAG: HAD family hydrolase [Halobacteriaceae archaeon]
MAADVSAGYDYWLFDLDGTLVDTEWSYKRDLFDRVGARIGRGFDDRQVERIWHGLGGDRDDVLRAAGADPERFWAVFDELDDPVARAEATYLYDDAEPVGNFERPVGVVTHCPGPVTERVLSHLDVADWFDAVVCCSAETGFKPDPTPVETAIAEIGARPGDGGALVGDGRSDVGAARNAGIDAVHVERHGHERRGRCILGDRRVTRLTDL